jgi:hypothetical protein
MRRYHPQVVVDDCVGFEQSNDVDLLCYGRRGHDADGTGAGDNDARIGHMIDPPKQSPVDSFLARS